MTELHPSRVVRARLDVSYDGTEFSGWAHQPGLRTVQGELEAALLRVLRDDAGVGMSVRVTAAGRTDAGVHARGQVVHADIPTVAWERQPGRSRRTPPQALRHRLNEVLPADVTILAAAAAPAGFDARFSALERTYAYRVCDDVQLRDPLMRRHVLWHDKRVDVDLLNRASALLVGLRDFAAFCKARPGATTVRDLIEFSWKRVDSGPDAGLVVATVRADAFCHSMVRSLVGAVLALGDKGRDLAWITGLATQSERAQSIAVAPAHGLTMEAVTYPPDADLAARADQTRGYRVLQPPGN